MTASAVQRVLLRRPAPWVAFMALVVLASGLYFCFTDKAALDLLNGAFSLAALLAILVGIRWHRPAYPWPWYCFAAGTACLAIGNASWVFYDGPWQLAPSTPAPSDIAYFVGYAWALLGLGVLTRRR